MNMYLLQILLFSFEKLTTNTTQFGWGNQQMLMLLRDKYCAVCVTKIIFHVSFTTLDHNFMS